MKKLTRKIVLLSALVMMLGVVAFSDLGTTATGAAPCCSSCDSLEITCESLPPGPTQNSCYNRLYSCYRWCIWSC